jgi:hypothetical protein
MDENNSQNDVIYTITPNVIETGYFFGIPIRRWVEAVGFSLLFDILMLIIPFTTTVHTVLIVVMDAVIFGFSLHGIHNRSIIQFTVAEIKFRKTRRILHLRGPEYVKKKQDFSSYVGLDNTNLGLIVAKVKGMLNNYADRVLEKEEDTAMDSKSKK